MTTTKGCVTRIDMMDWRSGDVTMSFNPFRQRDLSRAQDRALGVALLVAEGDLAAIADAAKVNGEIDQCKLTYGTWEPCEGRQIARFAVNPNLAHDRDDRTVRITATGGNRRRAPWVELTYPTTDEAAAVLAAVGSRAARWGEYSAERAAAEVAGAVAAGRDPVYSDIPF